MNKRGQVAANTLPLALVITLFLFMSGTIVINVIQGSVSQARLDLSCSGTPDSAGTMMACLFIDATLPYFILILISTAGGYLMARILI